MEWSDKRPTKIGGYYLSIAQEHRESTTDDPVVDAFVFASEDLSLRVMWFDNIGRADLPLTEPRLVGAKWAPRETPADPFSRAGVCGINNG